MIKRITLLFMLCLLGLSQLTRADNLQQLSEQVEDYLLQEAYRAAGEAIAPDDIVVKIGRLDSRLRLAPCDEAPVLHRNSSQRIPGRALVKVSCSKPQPWSIFVPAQVSWQQDVVVARTTIQRGQLIDEADIHMQRINIDRAGVQILGNKADVVGRIAARRILAGKKIDGRYIRAADAVNKGDAVTLIARSGNIAIKVEAIALSKGQKGEQIRVRNTSSNRVVKARIIGNGMLEVTM